MQRCAKVTLITDCLPLLLHHHQRERENDGAKMRRTWKGLYIWRHYFYSALGSMTKKISFLNIMKLSWVCACFYFPLHKLKDQFMPFTRGLHENNETSNLCTIYPDAAYGPKIFSEASNRFKRRAVFMFYNYNKISLSVILPIRLCNVSVRVWEVRLGSVCSFYWN